MSALVKEWQATLTERERALHSLAAIKLKKSLPIEGDNDNGSYFPEKCHAFKKWLCSRQEQKQVPKH